MRSMASGDAFHRAYTNATQQALLEGHEHAFDYFGGVLRTLRYDNMTSVVKTWIEKATTRMVTFAYELRLAENDRRLATGYTRHIFVSRAMRPTHLPEKYHALFGLG